MIIRAGAPVIPPPSPSEGGKRVRFSPGGRLRENPTAFLANTNCFPDAHAARFTFRFRAPRSRLARNASGRQKIVQADRITIGANPLETLLPIRPMENV